MENLKPNTAIETKNNESKKEDLSSILNLAPNEKELQSYQEEIDANLSVIVPDTDPTEWGD